MESFRSNLESLIRQHFPDAFTDFDTLPSDRVSGHIVSPRFLDETFETRYRLWREFVDEHIAPEDRARLGTMFFFTPDEYNVGLEEQPAA